ncbi:hypothetical protein JL720_4901 [Aureococcus anophagefferens]|nr:hypothetical protein JL720_4901 [Aureococcus anophagefferens]
MRGSLLVAAAVAAAASSSSSSWLDGHKALVRGRTRGAWAALLANYSAVQRAQRRRDDGRYVVAFADNYGLGNRVDTVVSSLARDADRPRARRDPTGIQDLFERNGLVDWSLPADSRVRDAVRKCQEDVFRRPGRKGLKRWAISDPPRREDGRRDLLLTPVKAVADAVESALGGEACDVGVHLRKADVEVGRRGTAQDNSSRARSGPRRSTTSPPRAFERGWDANRVSAFVEGTKDRHPIFGPAFCAALDGGDWGTKKGESPRASASAPMKLSILKLVALVFGAVASLGTVAYAEDAGAAPDL